MQAVESQTLILYHTDLRGQWPEEAARALADRLPYGKRLEVASHAARAPQTLAGVALALHALAKLTGARVAPGDLSFPDGGKPHLARTAAAAARPPDFSISHGGPWVGCAAVALGLVGFDLEAGTETRLGEWAAREAALKACGAGIAEARDVELTARGARCRGVALQARSLGLFPGAVACVMTSLPVERIEAHALPLAELFDP
jgi:phosphopantetheinyl transferase